MFSKFPPISWPEVNIRNQVFWTLGVLSKKKIYRRSWLSTLFASLSVTYHDFVGGGQMRTLPLPFEYFEFSVVLFSRLVSLKAKNIILRGSKIIRTFTRISCSPLLSAYSCLQLAWLWPHYRSFSLIAAATVQTWPLR